jgi:hypothetical protein
MKRFAYVALTLVFAISAQAAQNGAAPAVDSKAAGAKSAAPTPTAAQDTAAASATATPEAAVAKIDPAKLADIRQLLELTGAAALAKQTMAAMEQNIKPLMTNSLPPGDYREKLVDLFFEKFQTKVDGNSLIDLAVVRYDENFSDAEIKQLITFYQAPLGHKVVTVLPTLSAELQQDGRQMGQRLGRQAMLEVLAEHPELAQALQEAAQNRTPPSK